MNNTKEVHKMINIFLIAVYIILTIGGVVLFKLGTH